MVGACISLHCCHPRACVPNGVIPFGPPVRREYRPRSAPTPSGVAASQRVLEPLFEKYDVTVSFWGHIHNYERTCKVLYSKCVEKVLFSAHCAGAAVLRKLVSGSVVRAAV